MKGTIIALLATASIVAASAFAADKMTALLPPVIMPDSR